MSNTDRTNDKKATRHRVADEEARTAQLTRGKTLPGLIALALLAVVVVVVFGRFCSAAATIHVTVNGTPRQIDELIRSEVEALATPQGGLTMIFGLYPGTPRKNITALMDAMERYMQWY